MTDAKLAELAALPLAERVEAVRDEVPGPTPEQIEGISEVWADTH